jgi:hypothetical protein
MKRLLFIFLIVIMFSCKKDTFCWQCEITKVYYGNVYDFPRYTTATTTQMVFKCDSTEKQITSYEKENTFEITQQVNNLQSLKTTSTCICKKQ